MTAYGRVVDRRGRHGDGSGRCLPRAFLLHPSTPEVQPGERSATHHDEHIARQPKLQHDHATKQRAEGRAQHGAELHGRRRERSLRRRHVAHQQAERAGIKNVASPAPISRRSATSDARPQTRPVGAVAKLQRANPPASTMAVRCDRPASPSRAAAARRPSRRRRAPNRSRSAKRLSSSCSSGAAVAIAPRSM
jgi:hypothetical protein